MSGISVLLRLLYQASALNPSGQFLTSVSNESAEKVSIAFEKRQG
jgi:hypothetical protein